VSRWPDFIVIGAMKCATSTLHEQLARQPGIVMSDPKEPCFFSDEERWAAGPDWYWSLFGGAGPDELCGESSTHYTKRPTYPVCVERMRAVLPAGTRFVYVMRDPLERLVSQYVHEWSQREIREPLVRAVDAHPELVQYSRYAMQLQPYLETFGPDAVLPVFFERLVSHPDEQLERIARFVGYAGPCHWDPTIGPQNVSSTRERPSPLRAALRRVPGLRAALRTAMPAAWWEGTKSRLWRIGSRPRLPEQARARLEHTFDEDLAMLGGWLGLELSCTTFRTAVDRPEPSWQSDAVPR
jgi:hypothetical protein